MHRVVVGIDGSPNAADALHWSATLAASCGAGVTAVTAFRPDQAEVTPEDFDRLRDEREQSLEGEWTAEARGLAPIDASLVDGDADDALAATADVVDADLVVVGRGDHDRQPGFLHMESVAEELLHSTTRPLAMIPRGARGPISRIVLGVDGSPANAAAVRWTAALAAELSVPVEAVSVEEPFLEWTRPDDPENWRRTVERHIEEWTAPISEAGVTVHAEAVEGLHPATALLETAEQHHADLVVVGAHGVGGLGVRAGGVAVKVAHHAEIPVVVVPPDPDLTES